MLRRWLILLIVAMWCVFGQGYAGSADGAAHIVIEPAIFDFAKVDEGATVEHSFKLTNTGSSALKLYRAYASCGCTTPTLAKAILQPGESGDLLVKIDTAMKQDKVAKTVFISSNDPQMPTASVKLLMDVRNPHNGMSAETSAKIFSDRHCASCHVDRGLNKTGMDLFNADCAMCHGPKAEGAVGPPLFGPYQEDAFAQHITKVTSFGSAAHRSMPGFKKEAGGPLSHEQIDSIVGYLRKLSQARGVSQ